jgi:cysteine desulfurase/selenocysteine lyase
VNWDSIRSEFPSLAHRTFLNTATFGQLSRRVTGAVAAHFAHRDELACGDFLSWFDDMDQVRASVGRLICCSPDDIAFIPNASSGLALLLSGIDWQPGDRIVTLEDEFPNNLYAPGALATRGVEFVECPWEQFQGAVNERTRVVALSSVNYNTGFAPPLEQVAAHCRPRGALLYVDGTQSVGALRFDAGRIQPDVLAVHGYKWLLSPNGAGFLYVKPELRQRLPPNLIGWRSHYDWRSVDNLHHGIPQFSDKAEKYEGGMVSFALLYALGASVEMMLEIGPQAIEDRVLELAGQVRSLVRGLGGTVEEYRSPIVAARFEGVDASQLARALKSKNVLVAARKGYLRVSPHFYNNESDVKVLAKELGGLLGSL